jgi:excinuclease ABC subunit C
MMREVLTRRFKRLLAEAPLPSASGDLAGGAAAPYAAPARTELERSLPQAEQELSDPADDADNAESPWPDLVLIDGGQGQLTAAMEVLAGLGLEVPMIAIAKGPDRDAGRETFFVPGRDSFKLPPRDPLLYFVERLRDEAHRFAVGSHRVRRMRNLREAGLQEIAGIGPTRKRALLHHFGTLKAIERASVTDLMRVDGISAETARRIYDFFHEGAA